MLTEGCLMLPGVHDPPTINTITQPDSRPPGASPRRSPNALLRPAALLLGLCVLSAALVVARWQLALPATHTVSLGDPGAGAAHFYGLETGEGVRFRWSRDLSAI